MRNRLFTLALGGVFALGTTAALAQDATPTQTSPVQEQGKSKKNMDPDQQLQRLTNKLNLSADQQNQIKPILEERQQKMQALSLNQSLTQDDRRSQAKSIKSDSNSRIEAVLNNDQKQKFEAMQEKKREKNSGTPQPPQQ
ncbi:MAG TPA: hypothetical protein VKB47_02385 [Terracidiphilus sp.]|nr:hypothetical protein [Terracidiphilus sp.]